MRYEALDQQIATENNLPVSDGAWVQASDAQSPGVVSGSPADKAGIKEGDIIVKIDNEKIDATHSLQSVIGGHKPGDKVSVTLNRAGKTLTLSATLGTAPSTP